MNARHQRLRYREHSKRIVLAQVLLGREWEPAEIAQVSAIVGVQTRRIERGSVVRYVGVGMVQRPLKSLELEGAELVD